MVRSTAIRSMIRPTLPVQQAAFRPTQVALARPTPQFQPHLGRISSESAQKWLMTLGIWGGALGGAGMLFLSSVPIFQHDVLMKIPFVASYFEDTTPDSDKAF
ncbi:unnamed protein product [Jaminaea pallidilutea]